jgi:hypothetical protein
MRRLYARYAWRKPGGCSWRWRDGKTALFETVSRRVERYRHGWMKTPDFALTSMESPVHSERCTPGSERGTRKPTRCKPAKAPRAHSTCSSFWILRRAGRV